MNMINLNLNELDKGLEIRKLINDSMGIIKRSNKLLVSLQQSGKKYKVKRAAGRMILQERECIKIHKAKLLLLGTSYEKEKEIESLYAIRNIHQKRMGLTGRISSRNTLSYRWDSHIIGDTRT
jgi:hypothetical protein